MKTTDCHNLYIGKILRIMAIKLFRGWLGDRPVFLDHRRAGEDDGFHEWCQEPSIFVSPILISLAKQCARPLNDG